MPTLHVSDVPEKIASDDCRSRTFQLTNAGLESSNAFSRPTGTLCPRHISLIGQENYSVD